MIGTRLRAIVVIAALVAGLTPPPALATLTPEAFEECLLNSINIDRVANGVGALQMAYDLNVDVRAFSAKVAGEGDLRHMTSSERDPVLPSGTYTWGENVAWHSNPNLAGCTTIHEMFMNSSGHRDNILSANKEYVTLGAYIGSEGTWVTELFFNSSSYVPPGGSGDGAFWDDDGSVFEADIEKLSAAGITEGCNPPLNDRFCPDDSVTRGQMAAFLVRALGLADTGGAGFVDDDGSLFEADIEKLAGAGITKGCNPPLNDRFCPDDSVTRGQMAALLVRGLGLVDTDGTDFVDDDGSVFEVDIEKLSAAGVTKGCNPAANNRFCPHDTVTRGEMAAFLVRALDL